MRRVVFLVLGAGCGFTGLGTGDSAVDGGRTLADGAPNPTFDAAGSDAFVADGAADAPADGAPVPCATGGAYCVSNGRCFTDCGNQNNCPNLGENCFTCLGSVRREICGASCASSACACTTASGCPASNEYCAFGVCVLCNALSVGQTCKNGEKCVHCSGGAYQCAKDGDSC